MKKLSLIVALLLFATCLNAQEWVGVSKNAPSRIQETLISSSEEEIIIDVEVGGFYRQSVETQNGKQFVIEGEDMAAMLVKGAPNLPMYPISMIIGDNAEMKVSVLKSKYVDFENIEVAPSKGNISRQINPDDVEYTYGDMYQQDAFYPAPASLGDPYILRDFRGQNLMVYPYVYNPITKTLRVYTYLRIAAQKISDDGVNKKISRKRNNTVDPEVNASYKRRFINYPENKRYSFLEDEGEMLVVCVDQYMEAVKPLVEWKNISGRPTKMVASSVTGTEGDLKDYIYDYYQKNPNLTYVLLVGEHENLPAYTQSGGRSDNYYGMMEGDDLYEELFVGRLSVNSVADATNQVGRIIHYERDIDETATWLSRASGVAAKEGAGHYNEIDYEHIDFIRDTLLNYTYTEMSQYYENVNSPTASKMINDYNKGLGIINYCNHGSPDGWAVADFSSTDVHKLTNDNKLPFIWSVACNNGEFKYDECFAEAWMRAKNPSTGAPTGAIGGMFSWISQPWIPPMYGQDEMVAILAEYREGYKHTLGGASLNGNMYVLDMDPFEGPQTHNTWLLFGDPSMIVRTKTPEKMNVTMSVSELLVGMTSLNVDAQTDFGIVTLSMDGEALASAYVNNGTAELSFSPLTKTGTAKIVVLGYNKVTEIIDINVVPAETPYVIYNSYELLDDNGQLDYAETANISLKIKNVGLNPANNVSVSISSDSEYVTILDADAEVETVAANEIVTLENEFCINVKPYVPNNTRIDFTVTCKSGDETWVTKFYITAGAPVFELNSINVISDGVIMPGQTATLQMKYNNVGNSAAYNVVTEVFSSSSDIVFADASIITEKVEAGETFTVTTDFTVDESVLLGSVYELVSSVTADYATLESPFDLKIGNVSEDFESGDLLSYEWVGDGNGTGRWAIDGTNPYEGNYCVKTQPIGNNQYTKLKLQIEVLSDGPISFYVKVSSEQYYDYMGFIVNGMKMKQWDGEVNWEKYTYNLKKGTHNLEWRYIKDSSTEEGEDCAYLDMITFPPVSVVSILEAVTGLTYEIQDKEVTLSWDAAENADEYVVRREGEVVSTQTETAYAENVSEDIVTYSIVAKNGNYYSAPAFVLVDPNRENGDNVTELMTGKVSIYPNPTTGILYVELDKPFDATVYNYQGQVVMRKNNNNGQIDMSDLSAGIYFLQVREGKNIMIEKVIVK